MGITVKQAAAELKMTPATVRYLMLTGSLPIGDAWKKDGAKRACFRVNRHLLDAEKQRRGLNASNAET